MNDGFYRAFEDRFRGSRELVSSRLQVYLPFVLPLKDGLEAARATDLGCGRGEWLELLSHHGFDAEGVDLDDAMLADCRALGLNVTTADALNHLAALAPDSRDVISAFHLVEHLPFDAVRELVREALRVLKPGGLLIMETPNPENLVVGTCNFYLDPTHRQPLPPQLLAFVPEYYGFLQTTILRLQDLLQRREGQTHHLMDVLAGVSMDYAVVALKEGGEPREPSFEVLFSRPYGRSLEAAASIYDGRLDSQLSEHLGARARLEQQTQRLESGMRDHEIRLAAADRETARLKDDLAAASEAILRANEQLQKRNAFGRYLARLAGLVPKAADLPRRLVRATRAHGALWVMKTAFLRVCRAGLFRALRIAHRYPRLQMRLRDAAWRLGAYGWLRRLVYPRSTLNTVDQPAGLPTGVDLSQVELPEHLSPQTIRILGWIESADRDRRARSR